MTAELEVERSRQAENAAVENAMSAVFDAKDRILERAHAEAGRIEARALTGVGAGGVFVPVVADDAERLRSQAEQMLADAERRAEAIVEAAERRLTEARQRSAEADEAMAKAQSAAAEVAGEESTWAGSAQQDMITEIWRKLDLAQRRIEDLEATNAPDQRIIERANREAEVIIKAAQHRSGELLQQAQAAVTMPGGEAIANAEERAASIIAEAEARARQMEEAVQGIKTQAESEVQLVRDEADRFHTEAEQAKADANLAVGQLAEARASYQGAKVEVEDLRAQLAHARTEIDDVRNAMPSSAPDYPPPPPVTAEDAADGIVASHPAASGGSQPSRPALEAVPSVTGVSTPAAAPVVASDVDTRDKPNDTRETDDDFDEDSGLLASERLRIAAQRMRRESGIDDDGPPVAGRGSRYERRSAGLPRIGVSAEFGSLRSRLAGTGSSDTSDDTDEAEES